MVKKVTFLLILLALVPFGAVICKNTEREDQRLIGLEDVMKEMAKAFNNKVSPADKVTNVLIIGPSHPQSEEKSSMYGKPGSLKYASINFYYLFVRPGAPYAGYFYVPLLIGLALLSSR